MKPPKKPPKRKAVKKTGPKKPRAPKAPKTRCSGTMTEAQYWQFVRSGLRAKSRRWKPTYDALNEARIPYKGDDKRIKWLYRCAVCKELFQRKFVSVDHIVPCGALRCGAHLEGFVERLFVEVGGFQVLCTDKCHQEKTNRERAGDVSK